MGKGSGRGGSDYTTVFLADSVGAEPVGGGRGALLAFGYPMSVEMLPLLAKRRFWSWAIEGDPDRSGMFCGPEDGHDYQSWAADEPPADVLVESFDGEEGEFHIEKVVPITSPEAVTAHLEVLTVRKRKWCETMLSVVFNGPSSDFPVKVPPEIIVLLAQHVSEPAFGYGGPHHACLHLLYVSSYPSVAHVRTEPSTWGLDLSYSDVTYGCTLASTDLPAPALEVQESEIDKCMPAAWKSISLDERHRFNGAYRLFGPSALKAWREATRLEQFQRTIEETLGKFFVRNYESAGELALVRGSVPGPASSAEAPIAPGAGAPKPS